MGAGGYGVIADAAHLDGAAGQDRPVHALPAERCATLPGLMT